MALQRLFSGRFLLGIGTSGPQVMQGWHGVRLTAPVAGATTLQTKLDASAAERLDTLGELIDLAAEVDAEPGPEA